MGDMRKEWAISIFAGELMQPDFMELPFQTICDKNTYWKTDHIGLPHKT